MSGLPGLSLGGSSSPRYAVLAHLPLDSLPCGAQVNSLRVPAPPAFKLLVHTNAAEAYLTYCFGGRLVCLLRAVANAQTMQMKTANVHKPMCTSHCAHEGKKKGGL